MNYKSKKILCLLLSAAFLFILSSCMDDMSGSSSAGTEESVSSAVIPVENPAPTASPTPEPTPEPTAEPTPEPTPSPEETQAQRAAEIVSGMTLEEKVSQLFMLRLPTDFQNAYDDVVAYAQNNEAGGYVLFTDNVTTVENTKSFTDCLVTNSKTAPFIGIDEEGGIVSRLASAGLDGYEPQPAAADIGASGDTDKAYSTGDYIGKALVSIGVNLNFAPDADVLTNPDNSVIGSRSFGSDPNLVSEMMSAYMKGLHDNGIMASPKHFPGHGGTSGDSHDGMVYIDYDKDHLNAVEYKPFERAIDDGAEFILVGHITVPNVDNSGLPASLSSYFITDVLRNSMQYNGIIITDAMDMGAIVDNYGAGDSCVMALSAGVDVLLMPSDYETALQAVLNAVSSGKITEDRINESAQRVINAKLGAGILK